MTGPASKAVGENPVMPGVLYILYSVKWDQYYIGSANDTVRRLQEHNTGLTPSTRGGEPWTIQYQTRYETLKAAKRKERYLKSLKSRKIIEEIVAGDEVTIMKYMGD